MPAQDNRKQAVSLRLRVSDIRKIKRLSERIGVNDSDVIRYALKTMLARLSPLCDPHVKGRSLVPVFIDSGVDLLQYFSLDPERLDDIVNGDAPPDERVDPEDIQLMALMGLQRSYAKLSLRQLQEQIQAAPPEHALDDTLQSSFRRHLYLKYVQREGGNGESPVAVDQPVASASTPPNGHGQLGAPNGRAVEHNGHAAHSPHTGHAPLTPPTPRAAHKKSAS